MHDTLEPRKVTITPWTTSEDEIIEETVVRLADNPGLTLNDMRAEITDKLPRRTWPSIHSRVYEHKRRMRAERIVPMARSTKADEPGLDDILYRRLFLGATRQRIRRLARIEMENLLAQVGSLTLFYVPGDNARIETLGVQALRLDAWLQRQETYRSEL